MARRIDHEAVAAKLEKDAAKIVTGYASQDFVDGAGNAHKAGEYTELTQDEYNRTKRHRLLVSKDRFEAQKALDEIDAKERARVSAQLNGEDFADEDGEDVPNPDSTTRAASSTRRTTTKRATTKRAAAADKNK